MIMPKNRESNIRFFCFFVLYWPNFYNFAGFLLTNWNYRTYLQNTARILTLKRLPIIWAHLQVYCGSKAWSVRPRPCRLPHFLLRGRVIFCLYRTMPNKRHTYITIWINCWVGTGSTCFLRATDAESEKAQKTPAILYSGQKSSMHYNLHPDKHWW